MLFGHVYVIMDFWETAVICVFIIQYRNNQRKKKYSVHPPICERLNKEKFTLMFEEHRCYLEKFFGYFCMVQLNLNELITILELF